MGELPVITMLVRAGRVCFHASRGRCILVSLMMAVRAAAATEVEISGHQAYLPDALGRLQVFNISTGTNTSPLATNLFLEEISGLALHKNYAFVSVAGDGLRVLDLAVTPPALVEGGRIRTEGTAEGIAMASHYAYVADGNNGFVVVDGFNPAEPLELTEVDVPGLVAGLAVAGHRLYAACRTGGLVAFDITDPSEPEQLGQRVTATSARRVRVAGPYAYVVCSGGRLEIVNVQNATNLTLVHTYQANGVLADVDVSGNFAVVATTNGTLTTLNISNPAVPVPVSTNVVAGGATALRLMDGHAYVRTAAGGLSIVPLAALSVSAPKLQEGVLAKTGVVGTTMVLSVWAVGTPPLHYQWRKDGVVLNDDGRIHGTTNIWLVISNSSLADAGTYSVTISNAFGQVASSNVLTMVTPGTPIWRGAFNPGGSSEGIDVANHRAYIAAGEYGFEVYDVLNPRHPDLTDGYEVQGAAWAARVENGLGYVAAGTNGLQVFDTIRYETLGGLDTGGDARGLFLEGGKIYVANGGNGLQVFHLDEHLFPAFLGGTALPGFAWNVFVADGIAYVAAGTNGLQILAVTNPAAMTVLGSFDTAGEARQVRVAQGKAFVADGTNGVVILDVTNPAAVNLLGVVSSAVPALDLEVVQNLLVVACGTNGLKVFDVTNPAAAVSLGEFPVSPAKALRLAGNYVYVATGPPGIQIFELAGLAAESPEIIIGPTDGVRLPGEGMTFQVSATGTAPLSYRWFRDNMPLYDNSNVTGASTPTLTVSNLTYTDSGEYTVVVRNAWNLTTWVGALLAVVPVGTPVLQGGYFNTDDALAVQVIGEIAFVASRLGGLQAIDWRDPQNPVLIGQHPTLGLAQDVCVRGRYAYVASWAAGLEVFDVLNPTNLVRVGHCDTPGLARQIRLAGSRVYVADRVGGLSIVDVSNPARPQIIGRAELDGFAEGVAAGSNHVFVAAAQAGLQVLNTTDPLAPVPVAALGTPGHAENLKLVGAHAYVAGYNHGLHIVDVSNPTQPTLLSEYQTSGDAFHVQVANHRAYIAEGISRVSVLDVSNPAAPALITTSLAGDSVHSLHVVGKHALYADRHSGLVLAELLGMPPVAPSILTLDRDGAEFVGQELVLSVDCEGTPPLSYRWQLNGADLTDSPTVVGAQQPHLRFPALALTNAGAYTVIVSNAQGAVTSAVAAVVVQRPGTPMEQAAFDLPGTAQAVAVAGNFAYVATGTSGLQIVDLTSTNLPVPVEAYNPTGTVSGLCLQGNLLYLALGTNGVAVLEISQPMQPKFLGAFDTPGTALNLDVVNGRAYVADGGAGLQIFNVANPLSPTPLGFLDTPGIARDVRVVNDIAYLAAGSEGVKIISVTNPAAPLLLGEHVDPENAVASAIRVRDHRAYVAFGSAGLVVLGITNPAAPVWLGNYPAADAVALDLVGNLAVLGNGTNGLVVLDISNPAAITWIGSLEAADAIYGVMTLGGMALLADGEAGLRLVKLAGIAPQTPTFLLQPTNLAALHGSTAHFEAWPAGGTPTLSYRWYFNDLPLFNDARISGVTSTRLTVSNVVFADAGRYQLRVFGPAGITNSAAAQLTFVGPLQAQINAAAPNAVVQLAPGVHTENLVLDRSLTLAGRWWNKPMLSGGELGPALRVLPGANVTLQGIAIGGGISPGTGGGIVNEGTLRLEHCLVADNTAANGGGIANFGTLHLFQSVVSNNLATGTGGGLYNATGAVVTVTNTTFAANLADQGGGIANFGTNTIYASLLTGNEALGATGRGGGLRAASGLTRLLNTTISGNVAFSTSAGETVGRGGGLYANGGKVEISFTTVADNSALFAGGGVAAASGSEVRARNSIFAGNHAADAVDASGTLISDGYILIQSTSGLNLGGIAQGNLLNVNARLGPLQDNGGPTRTHAPAADSPVIDAGASPGPTTDARGIPRLFDIPWQPNADSGLDLGAVEHLDQAPYLVVSNRTATGFFLTWARDGILQRAALPTTGWADHAATSPVFVATTTNLQSYFRLRTTPTVSRLTMSNALADGFDLAWRDFGILERAPTLAGPWDAVTGVGPYRAVIIPGENEFFRVRVLAH